jgi:hypothetical protein
LDSAAKLTVIGWVLASIGFILTSVGEYVSSSCSGVSALGYCYYLPRDAAGPDAFGFQLEIASAALLLIGLSMVVASEVMKRNKGTNRVLTPP